MHTPSRLSIHGQLRHRQDAVDRTGTTSYDAALQGATKAFSAHEKAKPKQLVRPGSALLESKDAVNEAGLNDRINPGVKSLVQGFEQSITGKDSPDDAVEANLESSPPSKRLRDASMSSRQSKDTLLGTSRPRPIVRGRSIQRQSQLNSLESQQSHKASDTQTPDHDHLRLPGLDNSWMRMGASRTRSDGSDSRSSSVSRSHYLNPRAGLNESALADAMVASSLASSLASSRAPSPVKAPKPPPPRRKPSRKNSLFHRARSSDTDQPRDSAHVGMRQTLRKEASPQPDPETDKRGHKHFMNRPNKHHEGSRKRWRDMVTESERKRYEGVWAANKGILLGSPQSPNPNPSPTSTSELVLDLIVRDIWNRSRLPADHLAEVWDLVNLKSAHALGRDEFVVGLWLIDQKLKGHKLPTRVSASVWESVQHNAGLKIARRL